MKKVCLFAFLLAVASANLAADLTNFPVTREQVNCLADKGVTKLILEVSDEKGNIKAEFFDGYNFAQDAGIAIDAIVIVNDALTPSELSSSMASVLSSHFSGTIWFQVLSSPKLWSQSVNKRLAYLDKLILSCKKYGLNVGIYSDAKAWKSVFGGQHVGSDILKSVPVWYVNDNGIQSFDDFSESGFGTWTEASLKNFEAYPFECDNWITSLNFY